MDISLKFNKDFERSFNSLVSEYGEDFEILNGVHASQLNFSDFIESFIDKNVNDVTIDNNANASHKDIASLRAEKGKSIDKLIAMNKIFYEIKKKYGLSTAKEWLKTEYTGGFYLHDFPSTSFIPYCFAYDLTRLAKEGLFFLDKYNNQAPKHLTTFIDDVIEYISFMSNRSSGAVGIPNVLIWTMYFYCKDVENGYIIKDEDYYLRQSFQKLIYRLNQPFMRIDQSAFVNVSIFDREYYMALFGDLIFPDGSLAIDYIDKFIEHEKIFMEVVSQVRSENMFTFPVLTYSLLYQNGKFIDEDFARWCSDHNCKWNDSNFFVGKDVTTLSNCCFDGDQEFYYYDKNGNKILTNFKSFVESKLSAHEKSSTTQVIKGLEEPLYIIDPNTGDKALIKAVSKLPNKTKKLITIELEDGRILKVTPDQKLFDNNSKQLVRADIILENPDLYDI